MSYRARPAGAAAEGEWRVPLALPNLEGYSLALAPKRLANFFISRRRLLDDFGKHYKGELMRNLLSGKVLLHADLSSVVSDKVAAMAGGGRAAARDPCVAAGDPSRYLYTRTPRGQLTCTCTQVLTDTTSRQSINQSL